MMMIAHSSIAAINPPWTMLLIATGQSGVGLANCVRSVVI